MLVTLSPFSSTPAPTWLLSWRNCSTGRKGTKLLYIMKDFLPRSGIISIIGYGLVVKRLVAAHLNTFNEIAKPKKIPNILNVQVRHDKHLFGQLRHGQPRHQDHRQVQVAVVFPIFPFLQSIHIPSFLCSDCIIFLFLGMSIFTHDHQLHWQFVLATIILCTIVR